MEQFVCLKCDGNIRTIGSKKGTKVSCRHCGASNTTTQDNL